MNHSIGDKIKGLRSQRNISQEALAKALFFSNRTISNWEQGIREVSLENLQKIADYFQVPMSFFTSSSPTIMDSLHRILLTKFKRVCKINTLV